MERLYEPKQIKESKGLYEQIKNLKNNKAKSLPKKLLLLSSLLFLIFGVWFVSSIPQVYDYNTNGTTTNASYFEVNYNWTCDNGFCPMNYFFVNTNYSYLSDYLVFMSQFENNSLLGENDTKVVDYSKYGNNASVTNAIFNSTGGYNNSGGFQFDGSGDYIKIPMLSTYLDASHLTASVCFKVKNNTLLTNVLYLHPYATGFYFNSGESFFRILSNSQLDHYDTQGTNNFVLDTWKCIAIVKDGDRLLTYDNGILRSNLTSRGPLNLSTSQNATYIGVYNPGYMNFNGSADYVYIYNKSLNPSEMFYMHNSQLIKLSPTNWSFWANNSNYLNYSSLLLNSTNPTKDIYYGIYVSNSTGDTISSINKLTQTIRQVSVKTNFSTSIGVVRNNPYGANTHSPSYLTANDNATWLQNLYLESKMTNQRKDLSPGSYYQGIANRGFEYYTNTSMKYYNTSSSPSTYIYGYTMSYVGTGLTGYTGLSSDAHSGNSSWNITLNNQSGVTIYPGITMQNAVTNSYPIGFYNISVWAKTNYSGGSFFVIDKTNSYTKLCSTTFTNTSGVWTKYYCSFNVTRVSSNNTEIAFALAGSASETRSMLIDDLEITKDGVDFYYWKKNLNTSTTASDLNWTNEIAFAGSNRIMTELICTGNPNFLTNYSANCVSGGCPPENATLNAILCANKTKDWTSNGLYDNYIMFSPRNEPDLSSFMGDLDRYNATKSNAYNIFYNNSRNGFKSIYPNNDVCALEVAYINSYFVTNFISFAGNVSNNVKVDCLSFHDYTVPISNSIVSFTNNILNNCTASGLSCPWIWLNELNVATQSEKNTTSLYNLFELHIIEGYMAVLNNFPSILSTSLYQWTETNRYPPNNASAYNEYPQKWTMVNALDNEISRSYNATKEVATICPANSTVYVSSNNYVNVSQVICQIGNTYGAIISNNGSESVNLTNINMSLENGTCKYPYNNITNLRTKKIYTVSNCLVNLDTDMIMDSYQEGGSNNILYLTSGIPPTITNIQPINLTYNQTSSVNFSANLTDDVGLTNSTLNILNTSDNTLIQKLISYVSGEQSIIQTWLVPLVDGIYKWWISLFDDEGKETISGNYTETIDTTFPKINITYPTNKTYNSSLLSINYTVNELNQNYCWFSNGTTNSSLVNSGVNFSTLSLEGLNTWIIFCNDSANNVNSTTISFTQDTTTPPYIKFEVPTTISDNYSQSSIYVNVTSSSLSSHSVLSNVGLKLWLRYNNETGENNTYALDYSGNGNNGTGNNTISSVGKIGDCMSFNGINSSVKIMQNLSSFNITRAITLNSWVYIDNYQCYRRILAKSYLTNAHPYTIYGLLTDCNSSNGFGDTKRGIRMELASNNSQHLIRSTTDFVEGQWYLITGTYDQTNGAKLYVNGVLDNSTLYKTIVYSPVSLLEVSNLTNGVIDNNLNNLSIGSSRYNNVASDFFKGKIDESIVVDRAWSLNEIQAYYNATRLDHNITNLPDGNYNMTAYAQDIYGNVNQTEYRYVTLDTTAPIISIVSPANDYQIIDYVAGNVPINVNFSLTDINNNSCTYNVSGAMSFTGSSSCNRGYNDFTFYINASGLYNLNITVNDTAGNANSSNINFSVLAYSGPETSTPGSPGEGTPTGPEVNLSNFGQSFDRIYNRTFVCNEVKLFLYAYTLNYTDVQFTKFRSDLGTKMGMAIGEETLKTVIDNFNDFCGIQYPLLPGNENTEEKDSETKINFLYVVGGVIIIFIIIMLISFAGSARRSSRSMETMAMKSLSKY